jgi:hypothetical protein
VDVRDGVAERSSALLEEDQLPPASGDGSDVVVCGRGRWPLVWWEGRAVMVGVAVMTVIVAMAAAVMRDHSG